MKNKETEVNEMPAWSIVLEGSKSEISAQLDSLPMPVNAAISRLLEMHSERPGWLDEDPADTWAKTVPHVTGETAPMPRRDEVWDTLWRLTTHGHPATQVPTVITIEAIRRAK